MSEKISLDSSDFFHIFCIDLADAQPTMVLAGTFLNLLH